MAMYRNFDNVEDGYISLGRFSNNYFNISDDRSSDQNTNSNVGSFNEYLKLGGRRFSSLLRFLVILVVFISLLVLIKLPVKNRIELRREMLEKALIQRRKEVKELTSHVSGNDTLEATSGPVQELSLKGNETELLVLDNNGESASSQSLVAENRTSVSGGNKMSIANFASRQGSNENLNVENALLGSHYNMNGINKKAAENDICNDKDYTRKMLKLVYELSYFALPKDTMNIRKFEASDVKVFNDEMWVVCDNSWIIGKFGLSLTPFSQSNKLLGMQTTTSGGNPLDINKLLLGTDPKLEDSQWEGIVRDEVTGHLFVIRESIPHYLEQELIQDGLSLAKHYHSHIIELALVEVNNVESYEVLETCTAEHRFNFDNKGFEGAVGLRTRGGEFYLLGLCEGNFCMGGATGEESGNGRLILMKKEYVQNRSELSKENTLENKNHGPSSKCIWRSVRMINIPREAKFQDYSSIDVRGNKVAITSQEDSSMWLGEIDFGDGEYLDPDELKLLPNGRVYYFPRDHDCDFKYCNIEGVSFISDNMIVTVSDKMKNRRRQSPKCLHKDQSIHIFAIP